jgi:micrococcal nuclease
MQTKTLQIALIISLILNAYLLYSLSTVPTANTESTEEPQTETLLTTEMMYESGKSYPLMRIVDGDTIVVGFNGLTQYVRLIGIDAPEPNDPGGPQCYAEEATRHLQEIAQAGIVTLHFDESQGMRDSYGRLLAYVELPDGTDLGAKMIEDGYAHEFAYKATYARQGLYQEAELFAVENEVGLWAEEACQ